MVRNDYRRALILLRAMQNGVGGHVRLERRTMMGSLQCTVTGLEEGAGEVCAALAARLEDGWRIVPIGEVRRDGRRQSGLRWTFDPRSVAGLPLERYQVVAVTRRQGGECRLLLFGFLNGTVPLDARELEEALCASACGSAPEEEAPAGGASPEESAPGGEAVSEEPPPEASAPEAISEGPSPEDGALEAMAASPVSEEPAAAPAPGEPAPEDMDLDAPAGAAPEGPARPDADDLAMELPTRGAPTALEALGLDPERRWPESIEPLRALFAAQSPFVPFAAPGYVFVRAGEQGSCPECAVGVRARCGAPAAVAYAIPGEAGEPPAGLEGYLWRDGWWIAFADAETGALLEEG